MRFIVCACLVILSRSAAAQTGAGSIAGTVTDPDGFGIPLARLEAKNTATGQIYKAVSAKNGTFSIPRLPAGTYDLTVPPIGFSFPRTEQKGVTVKAGGTARIDIHPTWGGNLGTPGDDFSLL